MNKKTPAENRRAPNGEKVLFQDIPVAVAVQLQREDKGLSIALNYDGRRPIIMHGDFRLSVNNLVMGSHAANFDALLDFLCNFLVLIPISKVPILCHGKPPSLSQRS